MTADSPLRRRRSWTCSVPPIGFPQKYFVSMSIQPAIENTPTQYEAINAELAVSGVALKLFPKTRPKNPPGIALISVMSRIWHDSYERALSCQEQTGAESERLQQLSRRLSCRNENVWEETTTPVRIKADPDAALPRIVNDLFSIGW